MDDLLTFIGDMLFAAFAFSLFMMFLGLAGIQFHWW